MSKLLTSPLFVGNANPYIHVSSVRKRSDRFIISVDHDGISKDIFAKIYQAGNSWFIWYEKPKYRQRVKNFSQAIALIEKEIMRCEA